DTRGGGGYRRWSAQIGVALAALRFAALDHVRDQTSLSLPLLVLAAVRQGGDESEVGQALGQLFELLEVEQILGPAGPVVIDRRTGAALLGERAQQRQDRRHARAAADEQQRTVGVRAQREQPIRAGHLELVS